MGKSVFSVGIPTKPHCNVLVRRCIVNCEMKCLKGDKHRYSQKSQLW